MSVALTAVDTTLPASALPAWTAYRAMLASKSAYFAALEAAEASARLGGKPRLAEQALAERLLEEHTHAVQEFKAALAHLGEADNAARLALIGLLGRVNEHLGGEPAAEGGH